MLGCGQAPAALHDLHTSDAATTFSPDPSHGFLFIRPRLRPHSSEPGTMPATWAELRSCLAALLGHFAPTPSAVVDLERFADAAERWRALAADPPLLPPDDDAEQIELLG